MPITAAQPVPAPLPVPLSKTTCTAFLFPHLSIPLLSVSTQLGPNPTLVSLAAKPPSWRRLASVPNRVLNYTRP
jgi:hypothetical protein